MSSRTVVPMPSSESSATNDSGNFWNRSLAELQTQLDAGTAGLTSAQAAKHLDAAGLNLINEGVARPIVFQLLARVGNPLTLLLLSASAIMALTGDLAGASIIGVIITLSIGLDFVQEHQAGKVVDALRRTVAVTTRVMRDGRPVDLPVTQIVPGDIVVLSAGDLIPADGRVIEATDCFVNQAALTGESYPVEKSAHELARIPCELNDAENALFAGGSIVSGTATMLVCQTGGTTQFGQIAAGLAARRPPTTFELGIRRFGVLIMRLTLFLVIAVLLVNWSQHRPVFESLLFSIALAVGLTPELLPMIVTITLSRGAVRMAHKQVIVKQLEAIQNLGCMDVLCTDKTGTLTEATVKLAKRVDGTGADNDRVFQLAYLNSHFETGLKSPLDGAILSESTGTAEGWRKLDEVPFDFERRRVSVLVTCNATHVLISKGAPEDIWLACSDWSPGGGLAQPLDAAARATLQATHDALAIQGYRLLGVAYRDLPATQEHARIDDETLMTFAGFVAFRDPPKADAAAALRSLLHSGITVKILTGDNELVTRHVCQEVGLAVIGIMSGSEVAEMDDLALGARAESVNLFCRVTPQEKNRVIRALKLRGHTVGYMGDGINDAPSLHSADVGISVESAVDVAKAAAQMVLLRSDLGVLYEGVVEGRRTFGNVMKYILMATSSNFGNMFSMAGATLLLPFLPMLPMQILLNNLLYDISEMAIPFDTVDAEDLLRPCRWDMGFIQRFMWIIGPVSSVFDFLTFFLMLHWLHADESAFHTGWFIESVATQVLVVFVIRTRGSPFKSGCSPWLVVSSVGAMACAWILPFTPAARMLGFVPLPGTFIVGLGAVVAVYLVLVQVVKWIFIRPRPAPAHAAAAPPGRP